MITHIAGGGTSFAYAVKKGALHIDVRPCREKCLLVFSNKKGLFKGKKEEVLGDGDEKIYVTSLAEDKK